MVRKTDKAAPVVSPDVVPTPILPPSEAVLSGDEIVRRGIIVDPVETKVHGKLSYGPEPAGYTIRLGDTFKYTNRRVVSPLDVEYWKDYTERNFVRLHPGAMVLGVSMEAFDIPAGVVGIGMLKTSYVRCGLQCTIPQLDPGWQGHLTLCIVNPTGYAIDIFPGMGFAQISFFRVAGDATYVGNYQGTVVPTPARG